MHPLRRLTAAAARPHLPRRTVRLRLTLVYGGLFLVSGLALLAITYVLVAHVLPHGYFTSGDGAVGSISKKPPPAGAEPSSLQAHGNPGAHVPISAQQAWQLAEHQ